MRKHERRRQVADDLFQTLTSGSHKFWDHVYTLFLNRDITRHDMRELVRRGLTATSGNYRAMLHLFGIDARRLQALPEFPGCARLQRRFPSVPHRRYRDSNRRPAVVGAPASPIHRPPLQAAMSTRTLLFPRRTAVRERPFVQPLAGRSATAAMIVNTNTGVPLAMTVEAAFDSASRKRGLLGRDGLARTARDGDRAHQRDPHVLHAIPHRRRVRGTRTARWSRCAGRSRHGGSR